MLAVLKHIMHPDFRSASLYPPESSTLCHFVTSSTVRCVVSYFVLPDHVVFNFPWVSDFIISVLGWVLQEQDVKMRLNVLRVFTGGKRLRKKTESRPEEDGRAIQRQCSPIPKRGEWEERLGGRVPGRHAVRERCRNTQGSSWAKGSWHRSLMSPRNRPASASQLDSAMG